MKKPELLLPGGNLEQIKTAFLYGADAVYAGLPGLSLREKAGMTPEIMKTAIDYAHSLGKKIYLAFNIFSHNADEAKFPIAVELLKKLQPDGLIISDPGIFTYIRKHLPTMPIHISTQANVCSHMTVKFWEDMGAKMCVLAREVSFEEIKEIRQKCPNIKLEMFVHGAMCMSYSGRCLISNFLTGRGANQGKCAHSCRWNYRMYAKANDSVLTAPQEDVVDYFLEEDQRRDEFMQIQETERGTFLMSSKDLCLMPVIKDIIECGVDCLKIEGRNKSEYYSAITARAYRNAIDSYFENPEKFDHLPYLQELETLQSRGFTLGFFNGVPDGGAMTYESTRSDSNWRNVGVITKVNENDLVMELRNELSKGDEIEMLSPYLKEPIVLTVPQIIDAKGGLYYDKLSAGHEKAVLIKREWLDDNFDKFPALSVARKRVG